MRFGPALSSTGCSRQLFDGSTAAGRGPVNRVLSGPEHRSAPTPARDVNDVHSELNRTIVDRTIEVESVAALQRIVRSAAAGGQRISVGGMLTWVAAGALVDAAMQIRDAGDFSALRGAGEINDWLA